GADRVLLLTVRAPRLSRTDSPRLRRSDLRSELRRSAQVHRRAFPATRMKRPDLPDQMLLWIVGAAALPVCAWCAFLRPLLRTPWSTPGSPELYLAGVLGALLLLVSMVFVVIKRSGHGRPLRAGFAAHNHLV